MFEKIQKLFEENEPELEMADCLESSNLVFQLRDCDGYRIGKLIFKSVLMLCVTTCWQSYERIRFLSKEEAFQNYPKILEKIPGGYSVVFLYPILDDDEDLFFPTINNTRIGYVVCKSIELENETNLGR